MKRRTPSPSISTLLPASEGRLSPGAGDIVIRLAHRLADGTRPGILTTVDAAGRPHARWLPTIGFGDFPLLYATIAPDSRELTHLQARPSVNWMFGNDSRSVVVNLTGRAHAVTDPGLVNRIWKLRAHRASQRHDPAPQLPFVLIETEVDNIECNIPREQFKALTGLLARAETASPASLNRTGG